MEEFTPIDQFVILLGFGVIIAFPIFIVGYIVYSVVRYNYWYRFRTIEPESKRILEKYFSYYRNLPHSSKKKFENRVVLFIRSKDWYGQDGLKITHEMKVLVAASAVQITFGFKYFQLPRFTKIFIYPKPYFSPITQKHHKGEVHPQGRAIKLSWDNFLKGFQDPNDGTNLALHEMTHAMSLENRFAGNGVSDFISPRVYRKWKELAMQEMEHIKTGGKSVFRAYAATNLDEFLSVSVEVFFEQPTEFRNYNPELFLATCKLLNQYPTT